MVRRPAPVAALPPLDPDHQPSNNHYWRYHGLDALLACKRPVTASLDEDLFIAVHQVCELSFHQIILDLERALEAFTEALGDPEDGVIDDTDEALYFLRRAVAMWRVVNQALPALGSLRAFGEFRSSLGPSSGFQSYQFRRVELLAGVRGAYWQGGTRDEAGALHPAEIEFERLFGVQVSEWVERYREHNLRARYESLLARAPLLSLREHPRAEPLLRALRDYDREQSRFHRAHLGVAVEQLARVGVHVGTGGTSFRDYLARYESEQAPLFAGLEEALPDASRRADD